MTFDAFGSYVDVPKLHHKTAELLAWMLVHTIPLIFRL